MHPVTMTIPANSPEEYLSKVPPERQEAFSRLRQVIVENLPEGFQGMHELRYDWVCGAAFIVSTGISCRPETTTAFYQYCFAKNFIAVYHMGLYAHPALLDWFLVEFDKRSSRKLDMGKSCIRFKNHEHIPFELMGEFAGKMTVEAWISICTSPLKR
ncbi:MAG: DUF1801 domain-containing protein [Lewinellaceae bacterium]|nr:DUF1801 domain-containing protein [Lewinellaceae bacterium]